jgi:putative protease
VNSTPQENKLELLAPAGSIAHIEQAILGGADAVYIGLQGLSARPDQWCFDLPKVTKATELLHSNGKKVYIAVNAEFNGKREKILENQFQELEGIGCDALIVGDWGLLNWIRHRNINMPIHVSTLLGVYNPDTVAILKEMGTKRVVMNTNLFWDEIFAITSVHSDIEYEIIAMGGICFNDNRRCHLPHRQQGDTYSVGCSEIFRLQGDTPACGQARSIHAGDIDLIPMLAFYQAIGITSFKIEGRTRSAEYVYNQTCKLRKAIDSLPTYTQQHILQYSSFR